MKLETIIKIISLFKIISINIRGFIKNKCELERISQTNEVDVNLIQET